MTQGLTLKFEKYRPPALDPDYAAPYDTLLYHAITILHHTTILYQTILHYTILY